LTAVVGALTGYRTSDYCLINQGMPSMKGT